MRIALIAAAALIFSATPAAAQMRASAGPHFTSDHAIGEPTHIMRHRLKMSPTGVTAHLHRVREAIRDGVKSGQLDRDEARALRREAARIDLLQGRMLNGGLSRQERAVLTRQVALLLDRVAAKRAS